MQHRLRLWLVALNVGGTGVAHHRIRRPPPAWRVPQDRQINSLSTFPSDDMKPLLLTAICATLSTVTGATWAIDCNRHEDHKPGYCGVVSTDKQCDSPANRVPGRCSIPATAWYVDNSRNLVDNSAQRLLAPAGSYALLHPDGTPVSLVASGGGNLVASGGGNLVASGGGNLTGRTLQSVGGKKIFILK